MAQPPNIKELQKISEQQETAIVPLTQVAMGVIERKAKQAANAGAGVLIRGSGAQALLLPQAEALESLGRKVKSALLAQANAGKEKSIAWLLRRLTTAVERVLSKRRGAMPTIARKVTQSDHERPGEHLEGQGKQAAAKGDANCCVATGGGKAPSAKASTGGSINFATGSETVAHTDFSLPGLMPIVWTRLYYSRLGAYDLPNSATGQDAVPAYLGARWTSPYTTRIEQDEDGSLRYFAADGREHLFPALAGPGDDHSGRDGYLNAIGQTHHNAIEDLTLGRGNVYTLVLSHGRDFIETFELAPAFVRNGKPQTKNRAVCYRLISQRTQAGHTTELSYRHPGGQLSDIVSGNTHVCTALDERGCIRGLWLVQDGVAARELARYTYAHNADGSSDLIGAQDEYQNSWRYGYLQAAPGKALHPPQRQSTHLLNAYSDRTGRGMRLSWMHPDGFEAPLNARNSAQARAWYEQADDGSFGTTIVGNKHIRLTTVIDAMGAHTLYYFDILGYVYRIVYPEIKDEHGQIWRHQEWFVRDARKNITSHVHPDGSRDSYSYDAKGNLIRQTRPDNTTIHFAYDAADNLTGIRDGEGHVWKRAYDGVNLVEEIDPLGHKTEYAYNEAGLPVEITDAKGGKKQMAYNSAGQLTAYTDCSGKTSLWSYDERGRLIKAVNAARETTHYHYERGQLAQVELPDGNKEHLEHDAEGRLLIHRDALQRETRYQYSQAGLISQRQDANGHLLEYQWDKLGRLLSLHNENARQHRFQYNERGQLVGEVHFDNAATQYRYAPANGILRQIKEAHGLTQLQFDPMGRLTERRASLYKQDSPQTREIDAASVLTESYGYNANGQLSDARNANVHLQWFYTPTGLIRAEHQHGRSGEQIATAVWQHSHDALGVRTQTIRPDGHTIDWLTYGSGHVHGLLLDGQEVLQFERDDLHREVKRMQSNQIAQESQYDPAGRLKAQILRRAERLSQSTGTAVNANALNVQRHYRYDRAGQLTDIGDSRRGALSYRYDPVGRLLQATSGLGTEHFAFDPASNTLDADPARHGSLSTASHTSRIHGLPAVLNNLIAQYAGTHYEYDARGNMTLRVHNGQSTRFRWDAFGRLIEARGNQTSTTFSYDPLGRRMAKRSAPIIVTPSGAGSGWYAQEYRRQVQERALGTTLYGWDGDQMVTEIDTTRQTATHYIYEPGGFTPLMQARTAVDPRSAFLRRPINYAQAYANDAGEYDMDRDPLYNGQYAPGIDEHGEGPAPLRDIHYYQCDHLGTPMELTDSEGKLAWEANYKAWGEARITISEAARKAGIRNQIRFQGQYLDDETGLHYNRFRYYDPQAGRFVSKDPIGLQGGINLLQYAPSPIGWIDPFGLCPCPKGTIESAKIHFMQSNARNQTGDFTVLGNAENLSSGVLEADVLKIRVWKDLTGKIWTLDHRRLAAFKLANQKCVPVNEIDQDQLDRSEVARKMTTRNGGVSMDLKLEDGRRIKVQK
ncbi:RHS repeat-associated core domain-containing protein [Variovorax sp. J22R133]|uniref:RHS repeat-associated core domain-containing protein n=1 Tax=Variovorax brevis TaxID=3053503 RepID=UPI002578AA80|nr:RHS repeat-associated core domain-containing protein [Variovorax sp. J22R133]MDM0110637.1 RHS repeat-associated core domain-containing protein [Variovorax sp. J22R133]